MLKRKIYIIISIVVVVCLFSFILACGSTKEEVKTEESVAIAETKTEEIEEEVIPEEEIEEKPKLEIFKIGHTATIGEFNFGVNSARWDSGDDFSKPEEGERFLLIDCTIENKGNESVTISSLLMFKLYDIDGYSKNNKILITSKGSLDGELGAGRKMSGEVAFGVGENESYWELTFEPEILGSGQIIFEINEDEVK